MVYKDYETRKWLGRKHGIESWAELIISVWSFHVPDNVQRAKSRNTYKNCCNWLHSKDLAVWSYQIVRCVNAKTTMCHIFDGIGSILEPLIRWHLLRDIYCSNDGRKRRWLLSLLSYHIILAQKIITTAWRMDCHTVSNSTKLVRMNTNNQQHLYVREAVALSFRTTPRTRKID